MLRAPVFLSVITALSLSAERLPMRLYTVADGLARDSVHCVVRDAGGFLWFGTGEGISRFDGYTFQNYRVADGLPDRDVRSLLQARDGAFWVATGNGVARFDPTLSDPRRRFEPHRFSGDPNANSVNTLAETGDGNIWAGTGAGLFLLQSSAGWTPLRIDLERDPSAGQPEVDALRIDREGRLWIGTSAGLVVRFQQGTFRLSRQDGLPDSIVSALLEDKDGSFWVGTYAGLCRVRFDSAHLRFTIERTYTIRDGLPDNSVKSLLLMANGSLWVGTITGVARFQPDTAVSRLRFHGYGVSNGLVHADIQGLAEDSDGGLWVATDGGGAARVVTDGFITFDHSDGLAFPYVGSMSLDREGRLLAMTSTPGKIAVHRIEGSRFLPFRLGIPDSFVPATWLPWHQTVLESRTGKWWSASSRGLLRFSYPGRSRGETLAPERIFDKKDGLPANGVGQVYEDSHGNIWFTIIPTLSFPLLGKDAAVCVLPSGGGTVRCFSDADGLALGGTRAIALYEDRAGQIWVGLYRVGIARYRAGRFETFTAADGVPAGGVRVFYQDAKGRLWLGTGRGGLARIEDPAAARLAIQRYTMADGLSSDEIQAITEDRFGRIYSGTGLGVDRLDVNTRAIHSYTTADGLALGEVQDAVRDAAGDLWFGTLTGISRLTPTEDPPERAIPVRISAIRVAGQPQPWAAGKLPDIDHTKNNVEIDFAASGVFRAATFRYQYRLDGADRDWTVPTTSRSIVYSNVHPGHYRFLVRTVTAGGLTGPLAAFSFQVLPPFWQHWWFLTAIAGVLGAIVWAAHRYRVARLLEIERMRTRIACDLHDDVGSALSKIVILSEVAKRSEQNTSASTALDRIAETSREVLESVGDLVWAINARTEHLEDLIRRMRSFATQVFEAKDVEFQFEAIEVPLQNSISPEVLRQVYLIFKEAVNNAARHSQCTRAAVSLKASHSFLVLTVSDNGKGFIPSNGHDQHGIESLKTRAAVVKGEISWTFQAGTEVALRFPLPK